MSQRVLIIGATSAIAEAVARRYATHSANFALLARDARRLAALAADLRVRGAQIIAEIVLDVDAIAAHEAALDAAWQALGEVDIVLVAHGVLPDQSECETSVDATLRAFHTNAVATIALCTALAQRLSQPATLAVISSVAGERGRASNHVYGSAKAAVTAFLSGLRQRLHGAGVNVLTIQPGFVISPMTSHLTHGLLWVTPGRIAHGIVSAIERRRSTVYLPWFWGPILRVIRQIPECVFRRLRL